MAKKTFNLDLLNQFKARVQRAQEQAKAGEPITAFSEGITGFSSLRLMGQSGDAQIDFPIIQDLGVVGNLADDEREALEAAQAGVQNHAALGRMILTATPGQPDVPLDTDTDKRMSNLDPTDQTLVNLQVVVFKSVSGG